ncbi:MAG: hypothetical protein D6694_03165 [Gammaproteobacteria bacterium]|nr:MAG: hypothetical protein D6694_03165 [Gammaproteobacteria bacterium]
MTGLVRTKLLLACFMMALWCCQWPVPAMPAHGNGHASITKIDVHAPGLAHHDSKQHHCCPDSEQGHCPEKMSKTPPAERTSPQPVFVVVPWLAGVVLEEFLATESTDNSHLFERHLAISGQTSHCRTHLRFCQFND